MTFAAEELAIFSVDKKLEYAIQMLEKPDYDVVKVFSISSWKLSMKERSTVDQTLAKCFSIF